MLHLHACSFFLSSQSTSTSPSWSAAAEATAGTAFCLRWPPGSAALAAASLARSRPPCTWRWTSSPGPQGRGRRSAAAAGTWTAMSRTSRRSWCRPAPPRTAPPLAPPGTPRSAPVKRGSHPRPSAIEVHDEQRKKFRDSVGFVTVTVHLWRPRRRRPRRFSGSLCPWLSRTRRSQAWGWWCRPLTPPRFSASRRTSAVLLCSPVDNIVGARKLATFR